MGTEGVDLYEKAKNISSQVRILGGPNNIALSEPEELATVDANSVETFTLEEFRTLILDCRKKEKDFIIARVTTPDPEDQGVLYNFYYAASELNRILFRFESDRRLLHRMKVRNPLNNMYILGQVYYYKVPAHGVDRALADYFFGEPKSESKPPKKAFSQVFRQSQKETSEEKAPQHRSKDSLNSINKSYRYREIDDKDPKEIIDTVQKGVLSIPKTIPGDRLIKYDANYFASDDDFLMQAEVREYFRINTLDPEDDFLFEIDRTQNDFFALLETATEDENEEVLGWKRILTGHISMLIILLGICLFLGTGPAIVILALPAAIILFCSFIGTIFYILFYRRNTFDTLAVNSVEEV
jgi:hypothetical protein